MSLLHYPIETQASGQFNAGEIIENKPIGFPQDGGSVRPYSSLFYWAKATALKDSTIGLHPHQGFEIMSFVLKGRIKHYDSQMRDWLPLQEGDSQIIRAGSGISHAEHMEEGSVMFQIWLDPGLENSLQLPASYSDYSSTDLVHHGTREFYASIETTLAAPMKMTTSGVSIFKQTLEIGQHVMEIPPHKTWSIYILSGSGKSDGLQLKIDDFLAIQDEASWELEVEEMMQIFVISTPTKLSYKRYQELYTR